MNDDGIVNCMRTYSKTEANKEKTLHLTTPNKHKKEEMNSSLLGMQGSCRAKRAAI